MKKHLILFLISLLFLLFHQSCGIEPLEINVMTYNVRYNTNADSLNSWSYRKDVAAQVVKDYKVDIVGTQEVLLDQLQDLKSRLPEYNVVGVGRDDGETKGEYCALFYKKDKFKELESGTFWLSETPDIPSKGWDGACPRVATWALLEDVESHQKVCAINTHLDHRGQVARINGVKLILDKISEISKGYPVVLTGDFNADPESDVIKNIIDENNPNRLSDSHILAKTKNERGGTYHNFGRILPKNRECIDYIFVTKGILVDKYTIVADELDGIYLSDHNPVFVSIVLK